MGFVVKKETKTFVAKKGLRCPDRVIVALSKKVEEVLKDAIKRAEGNGRKTLKEVDL